MPQITLNLPVEAMSALRKGPKEIAQEIKIAAVVQWYAEGRISQAKSAEILDFSREQFLQELYQRKVPAIQTDLAQLNEEVEWLTT